MKPIDYLPLVDIASALSHALNEYPDVQVKFQNGPWTHPFVHLISYRGFYQDLCIVPKPEIDTDSTSGSSFLSELEDALAGKMFEGYKGGEYYMTEETKVWVSEYGEVSDYFVVGHGLDSTDKGIFYLILSHEVS